MIGEVLSNRYRILRELGSGGMAWVYLAEDTIENRLVAVKVLYPQYSEDVSYIQRFNREAKLAIGLTDPHIVRVLDYGASRDVHYLVMEYIQGKDLREYLEQKGALSPEESLRIVDQVASALEKAHRQGIVHRDIKPQNLMMTPDGTVKVLDFGIARARSLPSLTQSGFVGSPYYISPEQAMGEEVDIRSDIYSLGIVLYEMLSGKLPFDAKSPWSIISQHIATEPPELTLPEGQLPAPVEAILNKTLAKRPEDRYQNPTELRQAVAGYLSGRPVAAESADKEIPNKQALLEDLYKRAAEANQTGEWQRAVSLYNQILGIDPQYKDTADRLSVAGKEARLAALYQAAIQAMEINRFAEAVDELREILSVDPTYKDARAKLNKAQQSLEALEKQHRVSALYKRGMAHFEAGEWAAAVEVLTQVEAVSPKYERTAEALAKAREHLEDQQRTPQKAKAKEPVKKEGKGRLALILGAAALLLLCAVAAFMFYSRGQQRPPTPTQTLLADDYSQALSLLKQGDLDKAIESLEKVVGADPNYSDGQATKVLYQAYLERGDKRRQDSNPKGALSDYQKALTLPVSDRNEAEQRQAAVMQELSVAAAASPTPKPTVKATVNKATATRPLTPTATLKPAPKPTSTPKPEVTPSPTIPTFKYAAPRLLFPEDGKTEKRPGESFILKWEPVGNLAADEYYRVYFESKSLSGLVVWGDYLTTKNPGLTGEPGQGDWNFVQYSVGNQSAVFVHWWVTVMQATGKESSYKLTGPDISPPSDRWVIKVYGQ